MKFIMYHYVRPSHPDLPYFKHLHIDDFRRQLDYFAAEYGFVPRDEFLATLEGTAVPASGVVLSFDDGLIDHYRYVLPELEQRNLWGLFYIPTGVYARRKLLDVHRIHCLLGRFGGQAMLDALGELVSDDMLSHSHVDEFRERTYARQDNDAATAEFKRILNYYLSYDFREQVLDTLMARFFCEEELIDEYYIPRDRLAEFEERQMLLGGHSVSHRVFSRLSRAEQQHEIQECFEFLESATGGLKLRSFCYPYGGFHSFNATTEELLQAAGCRFSLNVEPRDAEAADFRTRPQAIPRYDCNAFPYGRCREPLAV